MGEKQQVPGDFYVRGGRAMISLGPLSAERYCTYDCAFCYVRADFQKYPAWENEQIVDYLRERRQMYDIVYVSGDTDSFAPPRTDRGIQLLKDLAELDCDVLFTTRFVFSAKQLESLGEINRRCLRRSKLLIGCISIPRLSSAGHLEPKPIPTPEARIETLKALKEEGLITVLAMRPFLPIIPIEEYVEIIERCKTVVDIVLGEVWYVDQAGTIEKRVLTHSKNAPKIKYALREMDFDKKPSVWKIWEAEDVSAQVSAHCTTLGLDFFMRSRPAILKLRERRM